MNPLFRADPTPTVKRTEYGIKTFFGFDAKSPERNLPLSWCTYGYNVTIGDGRVVGNVGVSDAGVNGVTLPNAMSVQSRMVKATVLQCGEDNILVALMQNRRIYYAKFTDESFTDSGIRFGEGNVTFLQYHYDNKNCILLIGEDGQMFVYDGQEFTTVTNAPRLASACVFNERVYGTVSTGTNRLYFSDDLDPTNWNVSLTEGGYVDFADAGGKVTGVIGYRSNLYIFREYAVHKLSAYVDQSDYVLTKVYSGQDRIYFRSAAVVDDKLLFLTEAGFLYTDGGSVRRIFEKISPLIIGKEKVCSCSYGNKYYLSCGVVRDGYVVGDEGMPNQTNNGVFIYDFSDGAETILRGVDVGQFLPVGLPDKYVLLVLFNSLYRGYHVGMIDNSGKLFNTSLKKMWKSAYTDFGRSNVDKVIRRVYVTTTAPVTLTLTADKKTSFSLGGSSYSQIVPVKKKGHKVGLEITSNENFVLTDVTLEIDLVNRDVGATVQ